MRAVSILLLFIITIMPAIEPKKQREIRQTSDSQWRLSEDVTPISYYLNLTVHLYDKFKFFGVVTIDVTIQGETSYYWGQSWGKRPTEIILHSDRLGIDEVKVYEYGINEIEVKFETDADKQLLTIHKTDGKKFYESNCYIVIKFQGILSDNMRGIYKSSYMAKDNKTRWIAATHFEPTGARSAFPCFDEPHLKAKFQIVINTPVGYHCLSNMALEKGYPQFLTLLMIPASISSRCISLERNVSKYSQWVAGPEGKTENWMVYSFEETKEMSTYAVAFVVSDFKSLEGINPTIKFSMWAPEEAISYAKYCQEIGPKLMDFYERHLTSYQLKKIDHVAIPDFEVGGMENWGLIIYRESRLLYYDGISPEYDKKDIARLIAHELSHMWFGNLITMKWWNDLWLKEGFAMYYEYYALTSRVHAEDVTTLIMKHMSMKVETEWKMMDQFLVDVQHDIMIDDGFLEANSLTRSEINTPEDIRSMFDRITYYKGSSVIRMVSHVSTESSFKKSMKKFLKDNEFKNVQYNDLKNRLYGDASYISATLFFLYEYLDDWVEKSGYPVLQVNRTNATHVAVKQERFLYNENTEKDDSYWGIPLTWTAQSEAPLGFQRTKINETLPNDNKTMIVNVSAKENDWIIFNNQETGYYRVNYDKKGWKLIQQALNKSHTQIHVLNRAQLVDDALNLARAGKTNYTEALKLADYLRKENDYIPWAAGFRVYSFLSKQLSNETGYESFQEYIKLITEKLYNKLGFKEKENDDHLTHLHRIKVLTWNCNFGKEDCIDKTEEMFADYRDDDKQIPANLKDMVYCTALSKGDEDDWNFLWKKYNESRIAAEKVNILSVLGCTSDTKILRQYLQMSLDPKSGIRRQDRSTVFNAVVKSSKGVDMGLDFLINNYQKIAELYGVMNPVATCFQAIGAQLNTENQVKKLENFVHMNAGNLRGAKQAGKLAVEMAKSQAAWKKKYKQEVIRWFTSQVPESKATQIQISYIIIAFTFTWSFSMK